MARAQAIGRYGEDVAARFLVAHGMTVLDRNWRCAAGKSTSSPGTGTPSSSAK